MNKVKKSMAVGIAKFSTKLIGLLGIDSMICFHLVQNDGAHFMYGYRMDAWEDPIVDMVEEFWSAVVKRVNDIHNSLES